MNEYNHFEDENPCYRVAHDGQEVISVTFGKGKTSTKHQLITAMTWEDIEGQLAAEGVALGDAYVPVVETLDPEQPAPTETSES